MKISDTHMKQFEEGKMLIKKGGDGDKNAVNKANEIFSKLRKAAPDNALIEAYYGTTMLLIARDKISPLSKLKETIAGMKILDEAVSADPENSRIRLLRGRAAYRLPEKYFQRTQTAIEDYTFLIDREMQKEDFLNTEKYLQVNYELGEAYSRIGRNQDATICWNNLISETQDTDFLRLLKLKLRSVEGKLDVEHNPNSESPISTLIRRTIHATRSEIINLMDGKHFQ